MNKKFIKGMALTMAFASLAGNAVFAATAPVEAPQQYLSGDANCDGMETNSDLVAIARAMVDLNEITGVGYVNADVNKDGLLTNADVVGVAQDLVSDCSLKYDENDVLSPELYAAIYNQEKYKNNYVEGEVIINLKDGIEKSVNFKKLFPEVDIESYEVQGLYSVRLIVTLKEETRESVIEAINAVKDNPYVYSAHPNYIIEFDPHW